MVSQRHLVSSRARVALLGAILLALCGLASPALALPELTVASSGELVCHLTCARYRTAVEQNIKSKVKRKMITPETGEALLASIDTDPTNRCGALGMKNVPSDQHGCAEGGYLAEVMPTGYQLTGDGSCGECPTYLGAHWCEARVDPAEVDPLRLPSSKPVQYSTKGGAQVWKAPSGKSYFIKDTQLEFRAPDDPMHLLFNTELLTPQEQQAYEQSRARWAKSYDDARQVWGQYFYGGARDLGYRCCEDRDGDGMPACWPGAHKIVVSAADPNKYDTGLDLVGPDCDDTSPAITPAKPGPKIRNVRPNLEWAAKFSEKRKERATMGGLTVITPTDLIIDPGMCWINHAPVPLSVSLVSSRSDESLPMEHSGFTFEPEPPDALSGEGGISEEQFPNRRPPINWKTSFGTTPDDIGPWFKRAEDLEKAIKMVATRPIPRFILQFEYGKGFSSTKRAGLSNCFRLYGGDGEHISFRRGISLKTDLRDVLRNFLLPYTSPEPNTFSNNQSALLLLPPFSTYKERMEISFDLTKATDTVLHRGVEIFRDFKLAGRGSACTAPHTVLLHDQPGVYEGFALRDGDAYVVPTALLSSSPITPGMKYDWLATSVPVTHELGHAFGTLDDEYVQKNLTTPAAPPKPLNCSVNPSKDFSSNGHVYAEQPFPKGCGNHPDWFRSSEGSYMNDPVEERTHRSFNTVSCGIVVARLIGGNPKDYFGFCEMAAKR